MVNSVQSFVTLISDIPPTVETSIISSIIMSTISVNDKIEAQRTRE